MVESSTDLTNVFKDYCGKETTMEGKSFAKIAKDCNLLDKKLTATDVDLIFAKIKDKAERRITYAQFMKGLGLFAEKKGVATDVVVQTVAQSKGPKLAGTKADAVKFHDDKSLYTGVYAQGGPSTVDKDKIHDISQTVDRSGADVRGIKHEEAKPVADHKVAGVFVEEEKKQAKPKAAKVVEKAAPADSLEAVFNSFSHGEKEIDGKTFAKLAKDCHVINKACTATDIDLIFAKVKAGAARKITFSQFKDALKLCAEKRKQDFAALEGVVLGAGGPVFSGTKADAVKFHDDKSLYTGVYAQGGPSTVDHDKVSDISQTLDRSGADVRGVKK